MLTPQYLYILTICRLKKKLCPQDENSYPVKKAEESNTTGFLPFCLLSPEIYENHQKHY